MRKLGWLPLTGLVALILAALGGGAAAVWQAAKDSGPPTETTKSPAKQVPVRIFQVHQSATPPATELTGSVRPRYQTDVAFRVSGKVLSRHVEVGDRVTKGQLLFALDAEDYVLQQRNAQANLLVAKATLLQATAEEKRLLELRRSNAVSASEYDSGLSDRDIAQGRLDGAQRQLELANNQLDYCQLKADGDGIVTSLSAEAGQVVNLGTTVCSIAQLSELEAVIDIPENRWPREAELVTQATFWSLPGVSCQARLREISPTADPFTRTYRARFSLIDPPQAIKLGMTVTVALTTATRAEGFEIPSTAIASQGEQAIVWRVETDGSLTAVPVTIAQYSQSGVRVIAGLKGGEQIVSAGVQKLDPAIKVRPWEIQK